MINRTVITIIGLYYFVNGYHAIGAVCIIGAWKVGKE